MHPQMITRAWMFYIASRIVWNLLMTSPIALSPLLASRKLFPLNRKMNTWGRGWGSDLGSSGCQRISFYPNPSPLRLIQNRGELNTLKDNSRQSMLLGEVRGVLKNQFKGASQRMWMG